MPTRVKIGLALCIAVVLGFAGYAAYQKGNVNESFVKEINRNLSAGDRKIFEDRVADAKQKLASTQTDDERFGWQMQIGYNLEALGTLSEAQEAFEQAGKIKPDEATSYAALSQVQQERGNYEGAKESIKTAISKQSTNPQYWKNYAQLEIQYLHASNDIISALYSEAVVKTNNNIDIITTYADWLEKAGNLQGSKEYWQKAIVINPAGKKIYQAEIDKINKQLKAQG
ncbi:MAG: tetratricopeptide repeat protein [Candidatus Doudnabacteria bacterium]|nr:tetratricopeptide repeat protein [Candidatus Doudnabacteria bacterium]